MRLQALHDGLNLLGERRAVLVDAAEDIWQRVWARPAIAQCACVDALGAREPLQQTAMINTRTRSRSLAASRRADSERQ